MNNGVNFTKQRYIERLKQSRWSVTHFNYNTLEDTQGVTIPSDFFVDEAEKIFGDSLVSINIRTNTRNGRVSLNIRRNM